MLQTHSILTTRECVYSHLGSYYLLNTRIISIKFGENKLNLSLLLAAALISVEDKTRS